MDPFMQLACELAAENLKTNAGGPFGSCVVKDGKVVGRGSNHVLAHHDPTAHGEVMAIRDACRNLGTHDLSGCVLYTNAYPCPMCLSAIIWANIGKVYYGNTKEEAAEIGFRDDYIYKFIDTLFEGGSEEEVLSLEQKDHGETIKVFGAFRDKTDKTIY